MGIRPTSLLLILAIVIVIFGTKRLRTIGRDLGEAVKDFRESISESHPVPKKSDES